MAEQSGKTIEEILAEADGLTIEQILGQGVDLSGPQGIGAGPMVNLPPGARGVNRMAEGAAEMQRSQEAYNRGLVRAIPSTAAALALTPATGGMSLLGAMGTDLAGTAGADLATQIGMKLYDPAREINPMESAVVGTTSALTGGLVRGGLTAIQKIAGAAGGIPKPAINKVNEAAPFGGRKAYQMIREAPPEAEMQIAEAAQQSVKSARSPSYQRAKAYVRRYDATQDEIDTTPIYERIVSRFRSPIGNAKAVTTDEAAANKALDDLADTLPDKMSMAELESYVRRIRSSISGHYGQPGGNLKTQDLKDISAFARQYRDELLTGASGKYGPKQFAQSSTEMDAIKNFRRTILDNKGNLRSGVENIIRRLPRNRVLMKVFERYDAATGEDIAVQARELGLKRQWTPTDLKDAGSMLEALMGRLNRLTGPPARAVAKGITVGVPPRGYPSRGAAATAAFMQAMEQEKQRTP